jgi:SAM-dependent methyltransferase
MFRFAPSTSYSLPLNAPFDSTATNYDADFTHTPLARTLRAIVWEHLDSLFPPGSRVLELTCGTGEDAHHLAARGVHVLATDQSEKMLDIARDKCVGLPVEFARLDIGTWNLELGTSEQFDGVFSNFGGLNSTTNYQLLITNLRPVIRPNGYLFLVIMGRWCAWEITWHLLHGQPSTAFRRLRRGGTLTRVGAAIMRVYYPSTAELRRAFAPQFRLRRVRPLGNFLPPSYLEPLTRRWWFPFRLFAWLDRHLPWPPWADHTLYEWVKN